jgi:acetone carboxylase gamma subunit
MSRPFDENILIVDDKDGSHLACRSCDERICTPDDHYKDHLLQAVKPLTEANQLLVDPDNYINDEMEYREYYCPGCGLMMENEVIMADRDPVVDKEVEPDT